MLTLETAAAPLTGQEGPADPVNTELKAALHEFLVAFEAFKEANDERLNQVEARLPADVVTTEKVDRINAALDEQKSALDRLSRAHSRPGLEGAAVTSGCPERKAAWDAYMRSGDTHRLHRLESKALSTTSDPEGGYLVPAELESMIDRTLTEISPIRSIATVRRTSSGSYRKPVSHAGIGSGWVSETGVRPETVTGDLALLEFPVMELYAMPAATQSILDDAQTNLEQWLAEEVQVEFAEQEGKAFITGDGVGKPRGLLSYPVVSEASQSWGSLGYVPSGADGGFAVSNAADVLVELVYAPRQAYRQNGRWLMNRKTEAAVRKLKDNDGNYIWLPGTEAGQPASLLGYPVAEAEDMPDMGSNALAIAFGDFAKGYLVVDRAGIQVLRDPYSSKPYVLFYTTKRVGGGVQDFDAVKFLKFSES